MNIFATALHGFYLLAATFTTLHDLSSLSLA